MAEGLMAWEIGNDGPTALVPVLPTLESHLENWVEKDPTLVEPGLMTLGRQTSTAWGTSLDLLAIDESGNLAVIELKRGRSPREMVAQAIEYAAWVSTLEYDDVVNLGGSHYRSQENFKHEFSRRFDVEFPEVLNSSQRIFLVAPEFSYAVVRVTDYLSSKFGVPINAVSFSLYEVGVRRVLVRSAVVDEPLEPPASPNRQKRRSLSDLLDIADEAGTRPIVDELMHLRDYLTSVEVSMTSIALRGKTPEGLYRAGIAIYPRVPGEDGVIINVPVEQMPTLRSTNAERISILSQQLDSLLGMPKTLQQWPGWLRRSVRTVEQARGVVRVYQEAFHT